MTLLPESAPLAQKSPNSTAHFVCRVAVRLSKNRQDHDRWVLHNRPGQQMNASFTDAYAERIQKVIAYVQDHLDDDLSVDILSEVAGISKFHFHRLFSVYTGMSVAKVIREMRLRQAAYQLAFRPELKVIEVALSAGFSNPETFARAFKGTYGQSPSEFRAHPQPTKPYEFRLVVRPEENLMKPEIKTMHSIQVAVLEHRGPPESVLSTVGRFIEWRKQSGASPVADSRTFGIPYDDPDAVEPEAFRFDVCGELKRPFEKNEFGVVEKVIPGGRVAIVRHLGSYDTIGATVRQMYSEWLPKSGEELRDFPRFFEYVARMPIVKEHEQITDVYLPLK
jgi:AraC family transcriptional regulator